MIDLNKLDKKKIYYMASPYSSDDVVLKATRVQLAIDAAIHFMHLDIVVFPPIALNGPWATTHNIRGDWTYWERYDKMYIDRCDGGVIVLMLEGWDRSVGVTAEIEYAKSTGKDVYYITMEELECHISNLSKETV
jgi:hypothetical protein